MIVKVLMDTQKIWIILIKILKSTIQIRNVKYKLFFHYMIGGIRGRKLKIPLVFLHIFILLCEEILD